MNGSVELLGLLSLVNSQWLPGGRDLGEVEYMQSVRGECVAATSYGVMNAWSAWGRLRETNIEHEQRRGTKRPEPLPFLTVTCSDHLTLSRRPIFQTPNSSGWSGGCVPSMETEDQSVAIKGTNSIDTVSSLAQLAVCSTMRWSDCHIQYIPCLPVSSSHSK